MGRYPEKNQPHAKFTCVPSPRVAHNLRGAILLQTVMATSPSQCRFSKLRLCWGKWIILWIAASALGHSMMFAAETQASAGNKLASDPARKLFSEHCQKCHSGPRHKGEFQIESSHGGLRRPKEPRTLAGGDNWSACPSIGFSEQLHGAFSSQLGKATQLLPTVLPLVYEELRRLAARIPVW